MSQVYIIYASSQYIMHNNNMQPEKGSHHITVYIEGKGNSSVMMMMMMIMVASISQKCIVVI